MTEPDVTRESYDSRSGRRHSSKRYQAVVDWVDLGQAIRPYANGAIPTHDPSYPLASLQASERVARIRCSTVPELGRSVIDEAAEVETHIAGLLPRHILLNNKRCSFPATYTRFP